MKIVDEKGRLFGKVNLIDLLVLILIVAAFAVLGWKLIGKRAAASVTSSDVKVKYTVVCEDVQADICTFAGSQMDKSLIANGKILNGTITDVTLIDSPVTPGHYDLYLDLEAVASFSSNVYSLGSQEIRVGYEYIVKTSEFELTGDICSMEVSNG